MTTETIETLSLRDPAGSLLRVNGRYFRFVQAPFAHAIRELFASPLGQKCFSRQTWVETREISRQELPFSTPVDADLILEHSAIPFVSYAQEWSPLMLRAAAQLTLALSEDLLTEGYGLKDGRPSNIQFVGPEPVFVDMLSFEKRDAGDFIWRPRDEFVARFVFPLLVHRDRKIPLGQIVAANPNGVSLELMSELSRFLTRFSWRGLHNITIPNWLSKRLVQKPQAVYSQRRKPPEIARYLLQRQFQSLRRLVDWASRQDRRLKSQWSDYATNCPTYSEADSNEKKRLVSEWLKQCQPERVLDVGCNSGDYSVIAASHCNSVVGIDADEKVIDLLWQRAREAKLNILPLVVSFESPTPGGGWKGREVIPFLERATGHFDLCLYLGVIHHLLATARIPLLPLLTHMLSLSSKRLIVEYVAPEDFAFQSIRREQDFSWLTLDAFRRTILNLFEIEAEHTLGNSHRTLFLLRKRT